jgi:hypothetical protein
MLGQRYFHVMEKLRVWLAFIPYNYRYLDALFVMTRT